MSEPRPPSKGVIEMSEKFTRRQDRPGGFSEHAIGVTRREYDDMGVILKRMGIPFQEIAAARWGLKERLLKLDILMVNCGTPVVDGGISAAVRDFVARGGVLWASDWQYELVQSACGADAVRAGKSGSPRTVQAEAVDPDLRKVIGRSIPITFDLPSWARISAVARSRKTVQGHPRSAVTVHLKAGGAPITISFEFGEGRVIFTSFHNHAQTSKQEEKLLKYLGLQPIATLERRPVSELYREIGQ